MINLKEKYLEEIKTIIESQVPDCEVRAFGSRVTGSATAFSDLDLAIIGPKKLNEKRIEKLKDAFSESELPILIDILDWYRISEVFKQLIEEKYEVIWQRQDFSN